VLVAWIVLTIALIHPPHGLGIPICWMHSTLGVPCPGCGLTRSVSCAVRGMFETSWAYHPFGIPVLLLFASLGIVGLLPENARARIARGVDRRPRLALTVYVIFVIAFVTYGAVRALLHISQYHASR
jgi:hypothetical protein